MSKYEREQIAKSDKSQVKFETNGSLSTAHPHKKIIIDSEMVVYCPFCLYRDKLSKFLISDKRGISTFKAKCPECQITMLFRTLVIMTGMNNGKVRKYADWCYMYAREGFWSKMRDRELWMKRLKQYGWSVTFC
jgi:hypothetical protein